MEIRYAQSEQEILSCWEVVRELRPHLLQDHYLQQVKEMMEDGFYMVYVPAPDVPAKAAAFAGYRNSYKLFNGKTIYIDDLCTLPEYRGRGYAGQLLDFIHQLAKESKKTSVVLDSGYHRNDEHRLYLSKGYKRVAHHFIRNV
jgi:GNAT superfamily N-acetyltransferase